MSDPRFDALLSIGGNVMSWMSEKELNDADRVMCECARCGREVSEDEEFCERCEDLTVKE